MKDEKALRESAAFHGEVKEVIVDPATDRALVYFDTPETAAKAVAGMKGQILGHRGLQVLWASGPVPQVGKYNLGNE